MSRKLPAQDASLPPPTCTWCGLVPAKLKAEKEHLGKKLAKYLSYCEGCEDRAKSVPKPRKVPQEPPTPSERRPDGTRVRTEAQKEARKRQKQRAKERRRMANVDSRLGLAEECQRLDFRGVSIRKMLREM